MKFGESISHEAARNEFFDKSKDDIKQKYIKNSETVYPEVVREMDSWINNGGFGLEEIAQKREALVKSNYSPELIEALLLFYKEAEKEARADMGEVETALGGVVSGKEKLNQDHN